jgi:hypothetical protein
MHRGFWYEIQKETDNWEEVDIGVTKILKWIFQKQAGVEWTGFIGSG